MIPATCMSVHVHAHVYDCVNALAVTGVSNKLLTFDLSSAFVLCHSCWRICMARLWSPCMIQVCSIQSAQSMISDCVELHVYVPCIEPCRLGMSWASSIQTHPTADTDDWTLKQWTYIYDNIMYTHMYVYMRRDTRLSVASFSGGGRDRIRHALAIKCFHGNFLGEEIALRCGKSLHGAITCTL